MASKHDILSVLQDVQSGALTPEDALLHLKLAPFEDLGYAKVDYHRAVRSGRAGGDLRPVQDQRADRRHTGRHGETGKPQYSGDPHWAGGGGLPGGAVPAAV